jgi:hypothetical protein
MITETQIDNGKYTIVMSDGSNLKIVSDSGQVWRGANNPPISNVIAACVKEINNLRLTLDKLARAEGAERSRP